MPQTVRIWAVQEERLAECRSTELDLEQRLENWLFRDVSCLSDDLLVIGRQVETAYGGFIDLLCLDRLGRLVIVELKRDKTPREITAQCLDYASWVQDLSHEDVSLIPQKYLRPSKALDILFRDKFQDDLPDTINESHRILIVASRIDPSSERIVKYLSGNYGVDMNVVTFQYFRKPDGGELLSRVFLIDPDDVEHQALTKGSSKRRPNLSYDDLQQRADENGVGDLYRHLVEGLEQFFQKTSTRSSLSFKAVFGDRRKAVVNLIPDSKNPQQGVMFQIYSNRLGDYFGTSEDDILEIIPQQRKPWEYPSSEGGPDWQGFEGEFSNEAEIDRFIKWIAERSKRSESRD